MKTLILFILGAGLSLGSLMQDSAAPSGALPLALEKAGTLVGGQLEPSPIEPIPYFEECVNGQSCAAMAEENNDIGCPSVYLQWGGSSCRSRPCVYSCESSATGGMCESAWWEECEDTTLSNSPGLCGGGEKGHCNYTMTYHDGIIWRTCTSQGLCYSGDGAINCGVIRTCS